MRYKALVEYDGTDYYGFQRQRDDQPTIQAELEKAVSRIAREPKHIIGAGRTDRGVHARAQVISYDIEWSHGLDALRRAINANLPQDIVVLSIEEALPGFHPRFNARRRAYEYHILNAKVRSPLLRQRCWHIRRSLDVKKMEEASASLVGLHDFTTFGTPPQGTNGVRRVFSVKWQQKEDLITFYIEANAYLYRMVRSVVGSLKTVGESNWTVDDFVNALRACDRRFVKTVAPAHGLYLVNVTYND